VTILIINRQSAMVFGNSETVEQLEATLKQTKLAVTALKEEQTKQTEQLEMLVQQAQSIGKAVVCGERRQDAWSGVVVIN
jgi:hypothetical protein